MNGDETIFPGTDPGSPGNKQLLHADATECSGADSAPSKRDQGPPPQPGGGAVLYPAPACAELIPAGC